MDKTSQFILRSSFVVINLLLLAQLVLNNNNNPDYFQPYLSIGIYISCYLFIRLAYNSCASMAAKIDFVRENNYYIKYDLRTKTYQFSKKLRNFFGVGKNHSNLANVLPMAANNMVKEIQTIIQNYRNNNFSEPTFYFTMELGYKKFYFKCHAFNYKDDKKNDYLIFQFMDISRAQHELDSLQKEYNKSKSKYAILHRALDETNVGIWIRNSNLDVIYHNKKYQEILDSTESFMKENNSEIDGISLKMAKKCLTEKKNFIQERFINTKNKRILYEFSDTYDNHSNLVFSAAYDVNEKYLVQKRLTESMAVQADLLESSSNAAVIFDSKTKLQFYNQAFLSLWNLDQKWLDGHPKFETLLDKLRTMRALPEQVDFAEFKRKRLESFTNMTEPTTDLYHLPNGKSLRVITIPHAGGGLLFSYEDMTDKIALQSSYNTLIEVQKTTLDHLHEGICLFSESGKIKIVNPTFINMWQQKKPIHDMHISEFLELAKASFKNDSSYQRHSSLIMHAFNNRSRVEDKIERINGSVLSRLITPLPDGAILMADFDVTDSEMVERTLREKNNALQEADTLKNEFLTAVSLQFQKPLSSLIQDTKSLQTHMKKTFDAQKMGNKINFSANQLQHLFNEMIDLTNINNSYSVLEVNIFKIAPIIEKLKLRLAKNIEEHNLCFELSQNEDVNEMLGDQQKIEQILYELILMALNFCGLKSTVTLSVNSTSLHGLKAICFDIIATKDALNPSSVNLGNEIYTNHCHDDRANLRNEKTRNDNIFSADSRSMFLVNRNIELHSGELCNEIKENKIEFKCTFYKNNAKLKNFLTSKDNREDNEEQKLLTS